MSSAVAPPAKLPPLWGNSYWWTRAGALLGLASLLAGIVMTGLAAKHLGSCGLPNRLTNPSLAIEVARTWEDVLEIVGPCEAAHCLQSKDDNGCYASGDCRTICPDKVRSLAFEQSVDYVFIVIYWLFFLYLGVVNWKFCYWERFGVLTQLIGKVCGAAVIAAGSFGALADWRENDYILQALAELHLIAGPAPAMRYFAYTKWRLLFLAIGAASPVFAFWTGKSESGGARRSVFSQTLAWSTALFALSTAWSGVAASIYGEDQRLEIGAGRLGLVIIAVTLTLATAQYWRGGTMAALDKLASLPVLGFLANLFFDKTASRQTPNTDPNHTP